MVRSIINNVSIIGLSAAVSNKWVSLEEENAKYGADNGFNLNKFQKTTGVKGRYVALPDQTASDFCFVAADSLLNKFKIDRSRVGIVVYMTQSADYINPSTATVLQSRLGLGGEGHNCIAFDVNQGCSGMPYGINVAGSLLSSADCEFALLLCGEVTARGFHKTGDQTDSHTYRYLFGDAGSAILLQKNDSEENPIVVYTCTDGNRWNTITNPYSGFRHPDHERQNMIDDIAVFNFSISEAPALLKQYMTDLNTSPNDYDGLVLHQANLMIMKNVAKRSGFQLDKTWISIDTCGNTSSASIPLTIVKNFETINNHETKRLLMSGYGIGLTWTAMEVLLNKDQILPLIHTDDYFHDGIND